MADNIDLPWATLRFYDNEVALDQKQGKVDPVKFRFGAWQDGYLGAISGDILTGDPDHPRRSEKCLIALKTDDDYPDGQFGGRYEFFAQRPNTDDDANMKKLAELTTNYVRFHVPIIGAGGGPSVAAPNELREPNGIYWVVIQSDGSFVKYKNRVPFDYATGDAVWVARDEPL